MSKHKQRRRGPLRFLVLARTDAGPYPNPITVALHPDGPRSVLWFSIGPHAVNAGGDAALLSVLDHTRTGISALFAREFDAAGLDWAVPYLLRLAEGEDVVDEIVAAHRATHGRVPEVIFFPRR